MLCSKWYQLWKAHVRYDAQRAAKSQEIGSPPQAASSAETPVSNGGAGVAADVPKSETTYGDGSNEHDVAELSLEEDAAQVTWKWVCEIWLRMPECLRVLKLSRERRGDFV